MTAIGNELVELGGPGLGPDSFRGFVDKVCRNFPNGDDIIAPTVGTDEIVREAGKHLVELVGWHRDVSAEGGEHVLETRLIVVVGLDSEKTGAGMESGEVGGDGENVFFFSELIEGTAEGNAEIVGGEVGGGRALRKEKHGGSFRSGGPRTKEKEGLWPTEMPLRGLKRKVVRGAGQNVFLLRGSPHEAPTSITCWNPCPLF